MGNKVDQNGQPIKGLEVYKDMPEEVKNQEVDGKKRVVTKELPKKYLDKVNDKTKLRKQRVNEFLQLSYTIAQAQNRCQELVKEIESAEESARDSIQRAFKKLRLDKDKERAWRYDGRGNFIGVYNPTKPKEEKKK